MGSSYLFLSIIYLIGCISACLSINSFIYKKYNIINASDVLLIGFSSLLSWLGSIVIIVIKIFNNKVDVPTKLTHMVINIYIFKY